MAAGQSFYQTPSSDRHSGIGAWLVTTDHKRIGLMYGAVILFYFFVAVVLGLLMRTELMGLNTKIVSAQTYNALFTLHGVIMVFLFIIPGMPAILGNFLMPIQIGAKDVIFPRINLLTWYLFVIGRVLVIISLFAQGAPDTGWTFYVPFSITT